MLHDPQVQVEEYEVQMRMGGAFYALERKAELSSSLKFSPGFHSNYPAGVLASNSCEIWRLTFISPYR